MLYGIKCWMTKNQHENQVGIVEIKMLCWMSGKIEQDKIRNVTNKESWGITYNKKDDRKQA